MSTITKERLEQLANFRGAPVTRQEEQELARIALLSLEAEPVAYMYKDNLHADARFSLHTRFGNWSKEDINEYEITEIPLYSAPPAPTSVPECFKRLLHHAYGMTMGHDWNKGTMAGHHLDKLCQAVEDCRAAMLQGAEQQNRQQNIPENIPATQFKPVADLYGLTSPTGSETSFTFDAVEARDFIDGGWSCQEYVELERFQEAITNHTEDKLAMVDHSGDSNNMVESVTTACELRDAVDAIRNSGIAIDGGKILAERDALNSSVIPDDVRRMDWLVSKTVDVREPMVYGSHSIFWSQTTTDEEDDYHATKLREQIDAAMAAEQAAAPQLEVK
ncbi:TPA: hypothetical protein ACLLGK_001304 [Enterobacter roggenkampii]